MVRAGPEFPEQGSYVSGWRSFPGIEQIRWHSAHTRRCMRRTNILRHCAARGTAKKATARVAQRSRACRSAVGESAQSARGTVLLDGPAWRAEEAGRTCPCMRLPCEIWQIESAASGADW